MKDKSFNIYATDVDYVMKALEQIGFDDNWSNMYSPGDPIFKEVAERRRLQGK